MVIFWRKLDHFHLINCASVIDWEDVGAVPLKVAAISIKEFLIPRSKFSLDSNQDLLFQSELRRIEHEKSSSNEWSRMFLQSKENAFIYNLVRPRTGCTFAMLQKRYPEFMREGLQRSPEALKLAASEWNYFVEDVFGSRGIPVPNWSQYVEIQEGLGIYGRSEFERTLQKLRRASQKWLNMAWYNFRDGFRNKWRERFGGISDSNRCF
jgi:hypothetical protein